MFSALSSRRARRPRRAGLVLAVVAGLATPIVGTAAPALADRASDIAEAVRTYDEARAEVATAETTLRGAQQERAGAQAAHVAASDELGRRSRELTDQRKRYADLSAEYYVRQGAEDADTNRSMFSALSSRRAELDDAKVEQKRADRAEQDAEKVLSGREKTYASASEEHDQAVSRAGERGAAADSALAAAGARDLPAIAYTAYRNAAGQANAADPGCHLSAAVLAGIGRISSAHGRNLGSTPDHLGRVTPGLRGLRGGQMADTDEGAVDGDPGNDRLVGPMQLPPKVWTERALDGDGDGATDADNLFDAAATTAALLCAGSDSIDTAAPLERAVRSLLGDTPQTQVALGAARRYAGTEGLDLGKVPADPRASSGDGGPQFDVSDTSLAPGDVLGMIDWANTRRGTPYSQCLGAEARPQDPDCPPGTNRFGSGFFDCSGFVSSAYRRIGLTVPATTYAMEADSRFMSTKVSNRIDLAVMEPGDVFLMDGHTGMYVGGGMIIHAIGGGLTYQPVPRWVANGTFAVLRPARLLPPPELNLDVLNNPDAGPPPSFGPEPAA